MQVLCWFLWPRKTAVNNKTDDFSILQQSVIALRDDIKHLTQIIEEMRQQPTTIQEVLHQDSRHNVWKYFRQFCRMEQICSLPKCPIQCIINVLLIAALILELAANPCLLLILGSHLCIWLCSWLNDECKSYVSCNFLKYAVWVDSWSLALLMLSLLSLFILTEEHYYFGRLYFESFQVVDHLNDVARALIHVDLRYLRDALPWVVRMLSYHSRLYAHTHAWTKSAKLIECHKTAVWTKGIPFFQHNCIAARKHCSQVNK